MVSGDDASGSGGSARRQPPIADYGFLSDCHSAALVDRAGSIDWWCPARFDGPSVFARLLDPDAGHWSIRPRAHFETTRSYEDGTLVLRTVFRTAEGEVVLTDAAALAPDARGHDIGLRVPHLLIRRVEGLQGSVGMTTTFARRWSTAAPSRCARRHRPASSPREVLLASRSRARCSSPCTTGLPTPTS